MYIYCLYDRVNGRCYVGKTKTTLKARLCRHMGFAREGTDRRIGRALHQFGKDNFEMFVLSECEDKQQAQDLEQLWILLLRSFDPQFGYNGTFGGPGGGYKFQESKDRIKGPRSREFGAKVSAGKKGKPMHPNALANLRKGPGSADPEKLRTAQRLRRQRERDAK